MRARARRTQQSRRSSREESASHANPTRGARPLVLQTAQRDGGLVPDEPVGIVGETLESALGACVADLAERMRGRVANARVGVLRQRNEAIDRVLRAHGAEELGRTTANLRVTVARETRDPRDVGERVDATGRAERGE